MTPESPLCYRLLLDKLSLNLFICMYFFFQSYEKALVYLAKSVLLKSHDCTDVWQSIAILTEKVIEQIKSYIGKIYLFKIV